MTIEVKTSEYEFAHGKKPRGTGNWVFWMGPNSNEKNIAWSCLGKYTEAKKQAQAKARELGVGIITVGS